MKADRTGELLSAYLDGELTPAQRRVVEELLARSAEARQTLQQLRQSADALRDLPRHRPHRDLASGVLEALAQRRVHPRRQVLTVRPLGVPAWFGLSVTAAVLLLVAVTSVAYLAWPGEVERAQREPGLKSGVAKSGKGPVDPAIPPPPGIAHLPQATVARQSPSTADKNHPPDVKPAPPTHPTPEPDSQLASPGVPTPKMQVVQPPSSVATVKLLVRKLHLHPHRQLLREQLKQPAPLRIELTCLDTIKSVKRLQAGLETQGIKLLTDPLLQPDWKKGQSHTTLAIFTETLTVPELTSLLERLGAREARASVKHDGQLDNLVVKRWTEEDRLNLATLLGVDPVLLPATTTAPLGVDVHQPLEDSTADALTNALAGKGVQRPQTDKTSNTKVTRDAIVLPFGHITARTEQPAEVRAYLESRKQHRPGAIPVLLILRSTQS